MSMYNLIEYITVMLIGRYQEVCGNTIQMNQLQKIIEMLLIFLMIAIIVLHSNFSKKTRTNTRL